MGTSDEPAEAPEAIANPRKTIGKGATTRSLEEDDGYNAYADGVITRSGQTILSIVEGKRAMMATGSVYQCKKPPRPMASYTRSLFVQQIPEHVSLIPSVRMTMLSQDRHLICVTLARCALPDHAGLWVFSPSHWQSRRHEILRNFCFVLILSRSLWHKRPSETQCEELYYVDIENWALSVGPWSLGVSMHQPGFSRVWHK